MILENKHPSTTPSQQTREQLLQSLQPLTSVPLDQLTDEQVDVLIERLTALQAQKHAAQKQAAPEKPARLRTASPCGTAFTTHLTPARTTLRRYPRTMTVSCCVPLI